MTRLPFIVEKLGDNHYYVTAPSLSIKALGPYPSRQTARQVMRQFNKKYAKAVGIEINKELQNEISYPS